MDATSFTDRRVVWLRSSFRLQRIEGSTSNLSNDPDTDDLFNEFYESFDFTFNAINGQNYLGLPACRFCAALSLQNSICIKLLNSLFFKINI